MTNRIMGQFKITQYICQYMCDNHCKLGWNYGPNQVSPDTGNNVWSRIIIYLSQVHKILIEKE